MRLLCLFVIAAFCFASCNKQKETTMKMITPVNFSNVRIDDGFWSPRLQSHKDVTLKVCIDQIENQTGRIRNFENAAKGEGQHSGIYYDDSDVYKALEGMAYSLKNNPDPVLEAKCDEWIDKFAAAQQEDGYINTYFTLTGIENRWDNMDKHEMYCAGHMIEAGVAYYNVTGKRKLLDVCIRMADHMMSVFGPEKRHWVPGHEEIELALVKLYQTTGEKKYLDFANWLLEQRGHGYGSHGKLDRPWNAAYYQDDKPVREMSEIGGHAVRSMYLYCGMADVAAYTGDQGYIDALNRLWDDVVLRNMYITGGIGQSADNEGFTEDYDLPNLTAYCETCASVGMVLWNWRMNQFTGDSKYIDVLERSLYNGALAGISLIGDKFFYVNPLESLGDHHRQAWYGCACCPSQVCRFLPSIGNYVYGVSNNALWVNLYLGNQAEVTMGKRKLTLTQETNYPWDGTVALKVGMKGTLKTQIRLRIPNWCKSYTLAVNGEPVEAPIEKGYAVIDRKWKNDDVVTVNFDMPVELVSADPRVKDDVGKRAVQRGPLVYCIEEIDNPVDFDSLQMTESALFETNFEADKLGGIMAITAHSGDQTFNCIPYYAWDNREAGKMKVWIPIVE
ncbi:MAG: glycoside hydrolase family 127 protein [Bacteroidales bacterium]|nr:glycoside hydrolase family 127 protein [Bacteroidales bacterium]